mgnify:CR=1 FL=1
MKVIKFGGTSVGSANSILSVKRIVEAINEPLIVAVSYTHLTLPTNSRV